MNYVMQTRTMDGNIELTAAYTPEGRYIGLEDWAKQLAAMGVAPAVRPGQTSVCSIGFCEAEQKWYGWSHRAMYGFGIGSKVKKGDCAYQPVDADDFLADMLGFWGNDKYHADWRAEHGEHDGEGGVWVYWTYDDTVPNESLRRSPGSQFSPYPEQYGRGEWTALTLDDAKQMACDFAEGVG